MNQQQNLTNEPTTKSNKLCYFPGNIEPIDITYRHFIYPWYEGVII